MVALSRRAGAAPVSRHVPPSRTPAGPRPRTLADGGYCWLGHQALARLRAACREPGAPRLATALALYLALARHVAAQRQQTTATVTRRALARSSGLTPRSVSRYVAWLVASGLVASQATAVGEGRGANTYILLAADGAGPRRLDEPGGYCWAQRGALDAIAAAWADETAGACGTALALYLALAEAASRHRQEARARCGVRALAAACGVAVATAQRYLARLDALGLLARVPQYDDRGQRPNLITLHAIADVTPLPGAATIPGRTGDTSPDTGATAPPDDGATGAGHRVPSPWPPASPPLDSDATPVKDGAKTGQDPEHERAHPDPRAGDWDGATPAARLLLLLAAMPDGEAWLRRARREYPRGTLAARLPDFVAVVADGVAACATVPAAQRPARFRARLDAAVADARSAGRRDATGVRRWR
jgi:hypothetical protein